jgi:hypothetical protein
MKKRTNACLQRPSNKKARQRARRQAKRRLSGTAQSRGKAVVCEMFKTIQHFFPDLLERWLILGFEDMLPAATECPRATPTRPDHGA